MSDAAVYNVRDRDDERHARFVHEDPFDVKFLFARLTVLLVDEAGNDHGLWYQEENCRCDKRPRQKQCNRAHY